MMSERPTPFVTQCEVQEIEQNRSQIHDKSHSASQNGTRTKVKLDTDQFVSMLRRERALILYPPFRQLHHIENVGICKCQIFIPIQQQTTAYLKDGYSSAEASGCIW
jgi:hypothetical protein